MDMTTARTASCGDAHCGCRSAAADVALPAGAAPFGASPWGLDPAADLRPQARADARPDPTPLPVARVNGVALHRQGARPDEDSLRELAYAELLRQAAVAQGLLSAGSDSVAPALDERQRNVIEAMVDRAVPVPTPSEEECLRYYQANLPHYVTGQAQQVRHILFAVTAGVNVHALAIRAENALLELSRKDVPPGRFAALAAELSNCPSGAQGGDLGWIGPQDCAPELANELFYQKHPQWGLGLHPRLIHTRHGLHIIEVLSRRKGQQQSFEQVRTAVASQLQLQSRARALHQYMRLLAGQARLEALDLLSADSQLVQ